MSTIWFKVNFNPLYNRWNKVSPPLEARKLGLTTLVIANFNMFWHYFYSKSVNWNTSLILTDFTSLASNVNFIFGTKLIYKFVEISYLY